MKKAKTNVETFNVECPNCTDLISSEHGNHAWSVFDKIPAMIRCHCGALLEMPKFAKVRLEGKGTL